MRGFVLVSIVLAVSIGLIISQSVYAYQTTFYFHNTDELSISSNQVQGASQIQYSSSSSSARAFEIIDANAPSGAGTTIALTASISVPASGGNPSGYAAFAAWLTKPLQTALVLDGDVNLYVWMSSSFDIGFPDGSLFILGVADYSPGTSNVNVLSTYLSGGTLGNIFTSSPKEYSAPSGKIHITQHEFPVGDRLMLFAGAASTKNGYQFNVYFDGSKWDSRADIPADAALSVPEFGNATILLASCALMFLMFHKKFAIRRLEPQ